MRTGILLGVCGAGLLLTAAMACSSSDSGGGAGAGGTVVKEGGVGGGGSGNGGGSQGGSGGGLAGSSNGGTGGGVAGGGGDSGAAGTGGGSAGAAGGGSCGTGEECCSDTSGKNNYCLAEGCKSLPTTTTECTGGSGCETGQICMTLEDKSGACITSDGKFPADATECTDANANGCTETDRVCVNDGSTAKCTKSCTPPTCTGSLAPVFVQLKSADGGIQPACVCLGECTK